MKISKRQLKALEKAVEFDRKHTEPKLLDVPDLLDRLLAEARRVHQTEDQFSRSLTMSMIDSISWESQFYQTFSKIREGKPV